MCNTCCTVTSSEECHSEQTSPPEPCPVSLSARGNHSKPNEQLWVRRQIWSEGEKRHTYGQRSKQTLASFAAVP